MTMRDPSEVIAAVVAEMRLSCGPIHTAANAWADRLEAATPQPASADVDALLRDAMRVVDVVAGGTVSINNMRVAQVVLRNYANMRALVKGDSHAG